MLGSDAHVEATFEGAYRSGPTAKLTWRLRTRRDQQPSETDLRNIEMGLVFSDQYSSQLIRYGQTSILIRYLDHRPCFLTSQSEIFEAVV